MRIAVIALCAAALSNPGCSGLDYILFVTIIMIAGWQFERAMKERSHGCCR